MEDKYLSITAIVLTIVGLLFQHFGVLANMKERISTLETKMELFWGTVEKNVGALLKTYPTNIGKDVLIDKMIDGVLTEEEARLLKTILIGEMDNKSVEQRLPYVLVIGRLDSLLYVLKSQKEKKSLWKRLFSSSTC